MCVCVNAPHTHIYYFINQLLGWVFRRQFFRKINDVLYIIYSPYSRLSILIFNTRTLYAFDHSKHRVIM